jgi:hypothetical protein
MKPWRKISKRHLLTALALTVLTVGGLAFWRTQHSESSLLAAGRDGSSHFLHHAGLKSPSSPIVGPISRREGDRGQTVLRYEVLVDRKGVAEPQISENPDKVTGQIAVPLDVDVLPDAKPSPLGSSWTYAGWKVARDPKTTEEMWSRVKTEPENVRLDNALLQPDPTDPSSHIIELAALLQLGRYDEAARLIDNSWIWSEDIAWTSEWAHRLQSEMDSFQAALDEDRIAPQMVARSRQAIYHFAQNPKLAAFRKEFGLLVASQ